MTPIRSYAVGNSHNILLIFCIVRLTNDIG